MKILVQFSGGKDSQACLIKEEWRSIEGYEDFYEVSNMGNVRSVDRYTNDGKFLRGKNLKQGFCTSGYKHVVLCKKWNPKKYDGSSLSCACFFTK